MRDMHEAVPVQDTLCSGIGAIERLDGDMLRIWFYVLQAAEEGETKEKLVVAKIVALNSAIADAVLQLVAAINEAAGTKKPSGNDVMH